MKDAVFLVDQTTHKPAMLNGSRCRRGFPLLLIIYIIVFSGVILYMERSRWQNVMETLSMIDNVVSEQASIVTRMQINIEKSYQKHVNKDEPFVFAITPTFARPVQEAELTRLAQTFLHVPNFHWIIVEDSAARTQLVRKFLEESGLVYTHLKATTPPNYKLGKNDPKWKSPRGVEQRNTGLRWIREHVNVSTKGVVYFADDDNTYSLKLFREMTKIKKVGIWPVGLVGGLMVEKPICDNSTNKVVGFNAAWKPDRMFPIDMAGFAINLRLIIEKKDAEFSFDVPGGYQETKFLEQFATRDDLEPLADACTKVYVWHTRTEAPEFASDKRSVRRRKKVSTFITKR